MLKQDLFTAYFDRSIKWPKTLRHAAVQDSRGSNHGNGSFDKPLSLKIEVADVCMSWTQDWWMLTYWASFRKYVCQLMNVCVLGDLIAQMLERQGESRLAYLTRSRSSSNFLDFDWMIVYDQLKYTSGIHDRKDDVWSRQPIVHNQIALHKQHIENNSLMIGWSTIWDRSMYMSNQKLIDLFDL